MEKVKLAIVGLTLAMFALAVAVPLPVAAQGKAQTTCPVLGGNINKDVYVDYQGQRIYFCCEACIAEFRKDPEKFLEKLKAQGITSEKSPTGQGKTNK
jgi:YHS domain-containing protein